MLWPASHTLRPMSYQYMNFLHNDDSLRVLAENMKALSGKVYRIRLHNVNPGKSTFLSLSINISTTGFVWLQLTMTIKVLTLVVLLLIVTLPVFTLLLLLLFRGSYLVNTIKILYQASLGYLFELSLCFSLSLERSFFINLSCWSLLTDVNAIRICEG